MNKEEILEWLGEYNVLNDKCKYTINDDMTIDVNGTVMFAEIPGGRIPDGIKFNIINGNLYCNNNKLISLEGCPEVVSNDFCCYNNKLTSLEGGPKKVGRHFHCYRNELTTLEGCPKEIGGDFCCTINKLDNLKYMPAVPHKCYTDFDDDAVKLVQDIMTKAKSYEEGVETYQNYINIFGDE